MNNINEKFKRLDGIFIAFLAIQLITALTSYFLLRNGITGTVEISSAMLNISVMLINALVIIGSRVVIRPYRVKALHTRVLEEKTSCFFNYGVIRAALLFLLNMVNITSFLITGEYIYLIIAALIFLLFLNYRPTRSFMVREFGLNSVEEKEIMEDA